MARPIGRDEIGLADRGRGQVKLGHDDLRLGAQGGDLVAQALLTDLVLEFGADLVEGRGCAHAGLRELDEVPAELGLDRTGDRAGLHGLNHLVEGRDHLAGAEPAQIAARGGGGADGGRAGGFGEIGAGLDLGEQFGGPLLGLDENVRRLEFRLGFEIGEGGVVGRLKLSLLDRTVDALADAQHREGGAALVLEQEPDLERVLRPVGGGLVANSV